ncbi:hypothetical protein THMIRHAS_24160 [Thiosulfatimonas sediminis]|uniref:histidine kinase n=1 Tax=Thiosulfatimonas sediminis TaxID=2675054 RepID=A0A6F8PY22_9GAMM|nr:PAS domain S-box protein [Thiosulfatimonas sediminis]BBP47043.1 hypothetical protein THMIRHAS_24160 [Thiosulfatimonas sediminis]
MSFSNVQLDKFARYQKQLLTRLLGIIVLAALVLVPASWLRIFEIGFHPVMWLHAFMLLVLLLAWWGRQRLSSNLITSLLLVLFTALGIGASIKTGIVFYAVGFFVIGLIIAGLYFKGRVLVLIAALQASYIGYGFYLESSTIIDAFVSSTTVFILSLIVIFISRSSQQDLLTSNRLLSRQKRLSERRREQLAQEHKRLDTAFTFSMDGLIEIDITQEFVRLSPRASEILGLEKNTQSLYLREFEQCIDRRDRLNLQHAFTDFMAGSQTEHKLQYRIARNDQQVVWVQQNCQVIKLNEQGLPCKGLCLLKDISLQKSAQEAIDAKRLVLARVVEAAGQGIWQAQRNDDYWEFDFSPVFYQIIGHSQPDNGHLTLLNFIELVHPADQPMCLQAFNKNIPASGSYHLEFRVLTEEAQVRWVSAYGLYLEPDRHGLPKRNIGSLRDITEAKTLQADLMAAKESADAERIRLKTLMETANNGIHLIDEQANVIEANRYFLDMLGYQQSDIGWLNVADFEVNFERAQIHSVLKNLQASPDSTLVFDSKHRRKDGSVFDVQITLKLVELSGQQVFYAMSRDISDRKVYEQELLRAKRQAEEAAAAKSQFLANMSHEIRTPLNAVMNFLQFLRESPLNHEQSNYLAKAQQASQHLLDILLDILDFSKMDADAVTLHKQPFYLPELVSQLQLQLQHRAELKGLKLSFEIDPALPEHLVGDAKRLLQVLLNLTANAIKYTEQGSVVVSFELLSNLDGQVHFECRVRDTGVGIDAAILPDLFRPFTQVDSSHTRAASGVGLGLSICQQLLSLMGAQLQADSSLGKGSVFRFQITLPVSHSKQSVEPRSFSGGYLPTQTELAASSVLQGVRILLAEDNSLNQEAMQIMLSRYGAVLEIVTDGAKAVQVMRERSDEFDLLLMDIQMPVLDGISAARAIRALPNIQQKPMIALSASAQQEDRAAAQEAGMNGYLLKPFAREDFLQLVEQLQISPLGKHGNYIDNTAQLAVAPSMTGFELSAALERLDGSNELLLRMCRFFVDSLQETVPQLKTLMKSPVSTDDLVVLRKVLHRLLGSAAVVGAVTLSEKLTACQDVLKATDNVQEIDWLELENALISAISQAISALQSLLEEP